MSWRPASVLFTAFVLWVAVPSGAPAPDLTALLDRYERGDFAAVARAMAEIPPAPSQRTPLGQGDPNEPTFVELQRLAPGWITAAGPAAAARRRLVVAAFALELTVDRPSTPWPRSYPLLVWACELLRKNPTALPGERWWYLASIAAFADADDWSHLVGTAKAKLPIGLTASSVRFFSAADQEELALGHLSHARRAMPMEARLQLVEVQYEEHQTFLPFAGPLGINSPQTSPILLDSLDRLLRPPASKTPEKALDPRSAKAALDRVNRIGVVASRYEALRRHAALRADIELHQGFLDLRLEAWSGALAHLDEVPRATVEPMLIALSHHFRGWIYEQTGQRAQAIAAYRASLAAAPLARSVSILLAAQLTENGEQEEAYAILDAALKARPAPDRSRYVPWPETPGPRDPWPLYRRGEALLLESHMQRLRETLR